MEPSTESHQKAKPSSKAGINWNMLVWIFAGVVVLAAGFIGMKALFAPFSVYRVTLVDYPKEAPADSVATFTWRIDGAATTIRETTVAFGTVSRPGELGKEVKLSETPYSETIQDFISGEYRVPLQFVGNIALSDPGTYYFRVHALVGDQNYWSPEYMMEVKPAETFSPLPGVKLVHAASSMFAGDVTTFTWRVEGPKQMINTTSVYFGRKSTPGSLGLEIAPDDTTYEGYVKDFIEGSYAIPLQFVGNTQIATPGAYFYRVHAKLGPDHYWSDEYTIDVKANPNPTLTPADL